MKAILGIAIVAAALSLCNAIHNLAKNNNSSRSARTYGNMLIGTWKAEGKGAPASITFEADGKCSVRQGSGTDEPCTYALDGPRKAKVSVGESKPDTALATLESDTSRMKYVQDSMPDRPVYFTLQN